MKKTAILILLALTMREGYAAAIYRPDTLTLQQLRNERKIAAEHKRRIIFNNDGNEPFRYVKELSAKGLLAPRTLGLENTQVDAIFYCTSHSWGNFSHNTAIGSVLTVKENPKTATLFTNNVTGELIAAGLDPLKVMVDFGHQNNKEVFWSMRMNDTHDGGKDGYGPVLFNANKIKTSHPEYLVGARFEKGTGSWSAANYGLKEVRDYTFRFIEEVCKNYDVDGIELDFFRHRTFFKSTFKGKNASVEEIEAMTDLMRRIRKMTEVEGLKRKRPILISMRLPDSKEYAKAIGLDMDSWLKEGLLDMMTVGGYIRLNPWATSVALGHKYGVMVYPDVEESRLNDTSAARLRNTPLSYRAQALEAWMSGADGVYMFNFFKPKSSLWKEMGSREVLRNLDRDHFASTRGIGKVAAVDHQSYQDIAVLNPDSPIAIKDTGVSVNIFFENGNKGHTRLRIKLNSYEDINNLTIKFNGQQLGATYLSEGWLCAVIQPGQIINGINTVSVKQKNNSKLLLWTDAELQYRNGNF